MVWGKRAFSDAEFGRYHERLLKLLYANPARYREFMMVATKTESLALKTYYVGVPLKPFMQAFDEFEYVPDDELPKVIDWVIVADVESEQFVTRFRYTSQTIAASGVHFVGDSEAYR